MSPACIPRPGRFLHLCCVLLAVLAGEVRPCEGAPRPVGAGAGANGDELFNHSVVPQLEIEIPPEGVKVLENYRQVWGQPRPERVDVKVTVREGGVVYTNVALHLKGSYTFQPLDEKPSLTLNFDKFVPGQR